MYPLRIALLRNSDQSEEDTFDDYSWHFHANFPWTILYNVSIVLIDNNDDGTIADLFASNLSDYMDPKEFHSSNLIDYSINGPIHDMQYCHLASRIPITEKSQLYDFMNIFYAIDYFTIAALLGVMMIVSFSYGSWKIQKWPQAVWIIICNFLKNSFTRPKNWKKRLLLTCFVLFMSIFHTVFLGFLNTNIISGYKLADINTFKDLLDYNISTLNTQEMCFTYIQNSTNKYIRQLMPKFEVHNFFEMLPLTDMYDGNYSVVDLNMKDEIVGTISDYCASQYYPPSHLNKLKISSEALVATFSFPLYRKSLPSKIIKALMKHGYLALEMNFGKKALAVETEKRLQDEENRTFAECEQVFDRTIAEFSTLSVRYFRSTFVCFYFVSIVACIVFIYELYY